MKDDWQASQLSTYQDHVIAHLIGATMLGYFIFDEAAHVVLDIGLLWTIYVDGQMALTPQALALTELNATEELKSEIKREVESLGTASDSQLVHVIRAPNDFLIEGVELFESGENRKMIASSASDQFLVESCGTTGDVQAVAKLREKSGLSRE